MFKQDSSYNPDYYRANRERFRNALDRYRHTEQGYKKILLHNLKSRAKRQGFEFSLTVETTPWAEKCPIFGFPLEYKPNDFSQRWRAPTIIRVDPEAGYVAGNVRVVSLLASPLATVLSDSDVDINKAPKPTRVFTNWVSRQLEGRCSAPGRG